LGINAKSNGPNLNVKVNSSSEPYRINIETLGHTSTERIVDLVLHEVESDNRTNCCIDQQRPLLSGIFSKHLFLRAILGRKSYRTKLKFIVTATQPHTSMVATQGSNQGGWTIAPGFLLSPTKWVAQQVAAKTSAWPLVRSATPIVRPHGSCHRSHMRGRKM
jgi:hypothetical protein